MGGQIQKTLVFAAALGAALASCAPIKTASVQPPAVAPATIPAAQPGPWRIRKTEWTAADEAGFGQFVRAIAQSGCTTTTSCMQSAANPYHDSDPPSLVFPADCAKWVYMLRAYYASKNGLPFSYVSRIASDSGDPRFSETSNGVLARTDIVDTGTPIDTVSVLKHLHDEVSSATYRMDPAIQAPLEQDFYSPKIAPGSIRAGTAIYDIHGHVMLVYGVTADGSILYMDANPDQSVSRGMYGPQIPQSRAALGGGFKNFRPLKLEGAQLMPDGTYLGGHIVLAANDAIPDYALDQYRGNVASIKGDGMHREFRYNDASLNLYEYARASMSNGKYTFNPVYELQVSMRTLCHDAIDHAKSANTRLQQGVATLYADLSQTVVAWQQRDLRVVYDGMTLKDALADAYATQDHACVVASMGNKDGASPLDRFMHRSPETDVQRLIAGIVEPASFAEMQPVGH
jgi:hypothetical protein